MANVCVRWNDLNQTHGMCSQLHNTQINDSLTITASSHDSRSDNLRLTGTWITTYSEIWLAKSKLVNIQQCSAHTEREIGGLGPFETSNRALRETVILNIPRKFLKRSWVALRQQLWGVKLCKTILNAGRTLKIEHMHDGINNSNHELPPRPGHTKTHTHTHTGVRAHDIYLGR